MMAHVEEMARQAAEKEAAEGAADDEIDLAETPEEQVEENPAEQVVVLAAAPEEEPVQLNSVDFDEKEEAVFIPPAPRRMKFRTEEHA
jgi:hypothetical protein